MTFPADRMPPLAPAAMSEAQRQAADELTAGPRKGVKGPFIALLRSPEFMNRLQKVGEYLRFDSALPPRIVEFVTLLVSRHWTQDFEWQIHAPLAMKCGVDPEAIADLRSGRRPSEMTEDEAAAWDFAVELMHHRGVCDSTYQAALARFGETGIVDLAGVIGYFIQMAIILNLAHTPPESTHPDDLLPRHPL